MRTATPARSSGATVDHESGTRPPLRTGTQEPLGSGDQTVERLVQSFAVIVDGAVVCNLTTADARRSNRTLEEIYFEHVQRPAAEDFRWIE